MSSCKKYTVVDTEEKFNLFLKSLLETNLSRDESEVYVQRLLSTVKSKHSSEKTLAKTIWLTSLEQAPKLNSTFPFIEKIAKFCIGILLVVIGFALIIIPAPSPSFEIATLFYFSSQDGVTVMDLISLLIILIGIFLVIRSLMKKI